MKKFELTSGESWKIEISGIDLTGAFVYLTIKDESGVVIKKKVMSSGAWMELELTSGETWGLEGNYEGEILVILPTGEVLIEKFCIVFRERALSELW